MYEPLGEPALVGAEPGQVIASEVRGGPVGPCAASFERFIERYAVELEAGRWVLADEWLIPT